MGVMDIRSVTASEGMFDQEQRMISAETLQVKILRIRACAINHSEHSGALIIDVAVMRSLLMLS
jgi:hypothetical protein